MEPRMTGTTSSHPVGRSAAWPRPILRITCLLALLLSQLGPAMPGVLLDRTACAAETPINLAPVTITDVATLRVGTGPAEVGELICDECDDCEAGFAFLASPDTVAFYDVASNSLKMISLTTAEVRSIPGPPEQPWCGAAEPDGTLYLLIDRIAVGEDERLPRLALYVHAPHDSGWRMVSEPTIPWMGRSSAGNFIVDSTMQLVVGTDSVLYAIGSGRQAVALHVGPRKVAQVLRQHLHLTGVGVLGSARLQRAYRAADGTTVTPAFPGAPLASVGVDQNHNAYAIAVSQDFRTMVARVDRTGEVTAVALLPRKSTGFMIRGGSRVVEPAGSLLDLSRSQEGLHVRRIQF